MIQASKYPTSPSVAKGLPISLLLAPAKHARRVKEQQAACLKVLNASRVTIWSSMQTPSQAPWLIHSVMTLLQDPRLSLSRM